MKVIELTGGDNINVSDEAADQVKEAITNEEDYVQIAGEMIKVSTIRRVRHQNHEETKITATVTDSAPKQGASENSVMAYRVRKTVSPKEMTYYRSHPSYKIIDATTIEFTWAGDIKHLPAHLTEVRGGKEVPNKNTAITEIPKGVQEVFFS